MPYAVGQRLRCDSCGAEIVFTRACPCPDTETMHHRDICCGKDMRLVAPDEPTDTRAQASRRGA